MAALRAKIMQSTTRINLTNKYPLGDIVVCQFGNIDHTKFESGNEKGFKCKLITPKKKPIIAKGNAKMV